MLLAPSIRLTPSPSSDGHLEHFHSQSAIPNNEMAGRTVLSLLILLTVSLSASGEDGGSAPLTPGQPPAKQNTSSPQHHIQDREGPPSENSSKVRSGEKEEADTAAQKMVLGLTQKNFIIVTVVVVVCVVVLVTLIICCVCCGKKGAKWSDLTPSEIAAGMTPSMYDEGITADQLQPSVPGAMHPAVHPGLHAAAAGFPMPPFPGAVPGLHYPVPAMPIVPPASPTPAQARASTSSTGSSEKRVTKEGAILPKGVILPKALQGIKPKKNKNKKKKKRKKESSDEEEESHKSTSS